MCPHCGAASPGYVVAAGTGEVYSYVVITTQPCRQATAHRRRAGAAARGCADGRGTARRPPDQVRVGLPVQVEFVPVDDELTLPAWPRPGNRRQETVGRAASRGPASGGPASGRPASGGPARVRRD